MKTLDSSDFQKIQDVLEIIKEMQHILKLIDLGEQLFTFFKSESYLEAREVVVNFPGGINYYTRKTKPKIAVSCVVLSVDKNKQDNQKIAIVITAEGLKTVVATGANVFHRVWHE